MRIKDMKCVRIVPMLRETVVVTTKEKNAIIDLIEGIRDHEYTFPLVHHTRITIIPIVTIHIVILIIIVIIGEDITDEMYRSTYY